MKSLICDPFKSNTSRFSGGYSANYITLDPSKDSLKKGNQYDIIRNTCLSFTQRTTNNLYYVVNNTNINVVEKWIDECKSQFPTLEIEVIKTLKKDYKLKNDDSFTSSGKYSYSELKDGVKLISLKLSLSEKSNHHYSITNLINFKQAYFTKLYFLIDAFIDYAIDCKTHVDSLKDINKLVEQYCVGHMTNITKMFSEHNNVVVYVDRNHTHSEVLEEMEHYGVRSNNIVDFPSITYDKIRDYLFEIAGINYKIFKGHINDNQDKEDFFNIAFVKILYSKKQYDLESYLATQVIRIGLSQDLNFFLSQYYKIKEVLPDIGFWQRIALTIFGFDVRAYYWFTGARIFRYFTDEEFITKAKSLGGSSTDVLFRHFELGCPPITVNTLIELYKKGSLKQFYNTLRNPVKVSPKKDKYMYLRICDNYEVYNEDERSYYIKSDDFRVRKYLKTNFTVI
jgi:hypothetical protein